MTHMWREEKTEKYYRVQTDDASINSILKRRKGFKLVITPIIGSVRVYLCQFSRPDIAKKVLKSITGKVGKIDSEGVISYE